MEVPTGQVIFRGNLPRPENNVLQPMSQPVMRRKPRNRYLTNCVKEIEVLFCWHIIMIEIDIYCAHKSAMFKLSENEFLNPFMPRGLKPPDDLQKYIL